MVGFSILFLLLQHVVFLLRLFSNHVRRPKCHILHKIEDFTKAKIYSKSNYIGEKSFQTELLGQANIGKA